MSIADYVIIGGTPEERLLRAVHLRRRGISVHLETHVSKKARAFKRAVEASRYGKQGVFDLDDPEDREEVLRAAEGRA